ncbi:hypothetical protein ACOSQ2_005123 [Xanthoceras sorbifolium]
MFIKKILEGNDRRCHEQFRIEKHVFVKLCDRLKSYGLTSTRGVRLEETVYMFLMTLGHGVGNRIIQEQFQHLGETVSRQFGIVLEKVIMLSLMKLGHLKIIMKSRITFEVIANIDHILRIALEP